MRLVAWLIGLGFACLPSARAAAQETCSGEVSPTVAAPPAAIGVGGAAGVRWHDLVLAIVVTGIAVLGVRFVLANERRRRAAASQPRDLERGPYVTGGALGVLFAISLTAFAHPVGISGAIQNLTGFVGHKLAPGNDYWAHLIPVGMTWQVYVVIGVLFGALISSRMRGGFRWSAVPDAWAQRFGGSVLRRWMVAFAAGALMEIAAAISGGCTSGLALSGGIVLAPGAFVFMIAMFASGIPTARLMARRSP